MAGAAARSLFFAYLDHAWPDHGYATIADEFLDRALTLLEAAPAVPSLYGGYVGVAWVAQHLRRFTAWNEESDPDGEIDHALLEHLSLDPWHGDYDLIGGLVGIGVYAMERLDSAASRSCLQRVVRRLSGLAVASSPGATWLTPADRLRGQVREACPRGHFNMGVAHGVPGAIALLAMAESASLACNFPSGLASQAVDWLVAQRLATDRGFPAWQPVGESLSALKPARLAWCYGDVGVAATLAVAARARGCAR